MYSANGFPVLTNCDIPVVLEGYYKLKLTVFPTNVVRRLPRHRLTPSALPQSAIWYGRTPARSRTAEMGRIR